MENLIERTKHTFMAAEVEIRGLKPLLMSSPKEMYLEAMENPLMVQRLRSKKIDPKLEAEIKSLKDKYEPVSS